MSKVGPRKLAAVCYDHIGGALGESLYDALVRKAWLSAASGGLRVTVKGRRELAALGVPVDKLDSSARKPVNACVERHAGMFYAHIGSHLGSLVAAALVERGWLVRSGREFHITPSGRRGLRKLGVKLSS
jgi:ParB-like chromosome segregation protein Spo0J